MLFRSKDEVRRAGQELGLSDEFVMRHPFPGPGLAVRCIGALTRERLDRLREADDIFITELRHEIGSKIELSVRSRGPEEFGLRGKKWIASGLINAIVDGNYYSGNGPRPTIEETIAAAGKRGWAFAVAEAADADPNAKWKEREGSLSAEAITALAKHYSEKGADGFGIYESTLFTLRPDVRRAIRAAGWNFPPRKREA